MKLPKPPTLRKYGLTEQDYIEMYNSQGGCCPICDNPLIKTVNIDHFHAQGWSKMKPEKRKLYTRGLVCWFCNKNYLAKGITVKKSQNVTKYLQGFEKRKPK